MPDAKPSVLPARAILLAIEEGPTLHPESTLLASALAARGVTLERWVAEAMGDENAFRERLRAAGEVLLCLPYAEEWHALLVHLARLASEVLPTPPLFFGDALDRAGELELGASALRLPAPTPEGLAALLGDEAVGPPHLALDVLGGKDLLRGGQRASLFAETGHLGMVAGIAPRASLSPVAGLARWTPVGAQPTTLDLAALSRTITACGEGLRHLEWWDRGGGPALDAALGHVMEHHPGLAQSVRLVGATARAGVLQALREGGVQRVIFDCDQVAGEEALPQSAAAAEDLVAPVAAAQAAGLEVGILLAVGLPGETPEATRARVAVLRDLGPDRLRVVPFEATGGHPARELLRGRGLLPNPSDPWIREVHRPLVQPAISADHFAESLQLALDLLAEVEVRR